MQPSKRLSDSTIVAYAVGATLAILGIVAIPLISGTEGAIIGGSLLIGAALFICTAIIAGAFGRN